jgi:DNA-binding response OmpR family regulator
MIPLSTTCFFKTFWRMRDLRCRQLLAAGKDLKKWIVNKPDLVVLDIMMPRMDGFEVLKQIISNPVTKDIPVIMLTAKNDSKDEELAREIGAVDYMTKPVDIENTLQRIRKFLDH